MSIATDGLGTSQLLLSGLAEYTGEIVIVLPDVEPAAIDFIEAQPLEMVAENNYEGITLYLNQEWADFLQTYAIRVLFLVKRYYTDDNPLIEVEGTLDYANLVVTFDLSRYETDLVSRAYVWETSAYREDPDFYKIINNGKIQVRPTLRRIRDA